MGTMKKNILHGKIYNCYFRIIKEIFIQEKITEIIIYKTVRDLGIMKICGKILTQVTQLLF